MLSDLILIERFEKFSELTISKSLRKASRLMYDSMTVGLENATKYAEGVNESVVKVQEGLTLNLKTLYILIVWWPLSRFHVSVKWTAACRDRVCSVMSIRTLEIPDVSVP